MNQFERIKHITKLVLDEGGLILERISLNNRYVMHGFAPASLW